MVMKGKTRTGAMTTGKTKSQQAKELRRQQEMRKKHGTMAPKEPVQKKKMGGRALLGSLSPVYGMATGEGLFGESVGVLPAIAKQMRKRRGRDEEEVMQNPRNVPVKPGMSAAPKMMREGGKVKK
jgi:hypothetical protein